MTGTPARCGGIVPDSVRSHQEEGDALTPSGEWCRGRKVLCASMPSFGRAVPVLSLAVSLQAAGNEVYILHDPTATEMNDLFARYKIPCLSLPLEACTLGELSSLLKSHEPDITICDFEPSFWAALQIFKPRCRVSILRCELFPGYEPRSTRFRNKIGERRFTARLNNLRPSFAKEPLPADPAELYRAEIIAVPSVPEIDPVAQGMEQCYPDATLIYTGPLLLPIGDAVPSYIEEWIESRRREGRRVVLVTFGTISGAEWGNNLYRRFAASLESTDFAVVMIVPDEAARLTLGSQCGSRFQVIGMTDIHQLASRVDLVIHHCGHGTLQAVLLAGKPSLTVSTGYYDREDNALRLEELYCGRHLREDFFPWIPAPFLTSILKQILSDSAIQRGVARMSTVLRDHMQRAPAEVGKALRRYLGGATPQAGELISS